MSDRIKPVSFEGLLEWIVKEYQSQKTIFSIPESQFFRKENGENIIIFDEECGMPLGPAAGPHTQLAQNIITSYLVGGRFFELKTVQKLDSLEFEKPCIDARDEGYNTEWSTELSLEQAYDEYIKAWIIIHFLEMTFNLSPLGKRSFVFNMSVGYDLEGIKTLRMNAFIDQLIDASSHPSFRQYLDYLEYFISLNSFENNGTRLKSFKDIKNIKDFISSKIVRSVTLSTMHGCPPEEQKSICSYLIEKKKLNTYVKLNPTLLGYKFVRRVLNELGYHYISIKENTFKHDLQWNDAVEMIKQLKNLASENNLHFGVKLSNTLGTVNNLGILPGEDMYLSGRILFPLTIQLAFRLSNTFNGTIPISYSGGASQMNVDRIFETGINPITVATDLLKPGGYLRMLEMAKKMAPIISKLRKQETIHIKKIESLAQQSLKEEYYRKEWRGTKKVSVEKELPITDCFIAPCVTSCPIFQDIPEYISLAAQGKFDNALRLIYSKNPLPHITGQICDHQCMYNCTRLDYEEALDIRKIKKIAAHYGNVMVDKENFSNTKNLDVKVAIVGAGPAGLSAAYFLAKAGFKVTVFEKKKFPGGVLSYVLPNFRITESTIMEDISLIKKMGVQFKFGVQKNFSIDNLKNIGFKYIFIGIGAEKSKKLIFTADKVNVCEALDFLRDFKKNPEKLHPGKTIAVIGGGNTAVDSARSALRIPGVKKVFIIYRRTEKEMPADKEELEYAMKEGVIFKPLLLPETLLNSGVLVCRKMVLGEFDSSGRRQPVSSQQTEKLLVDYVVSAIGEEIDIEFLSQCGLKRSKENGSWINPDTLETGIENVFIGGDAFRGPSTVVQAIADARIATRAIITREIPEWKEKEEVVNFDSKKKLKDVYRKKGHIALKKISTDDKLQAESEGERCLECNIICNKCVDVCPNRANIAISVEKEEGFSDKWQIVHIDALCNECGNCATFCPYVGEPYKDKLTLFSTMNDFQNSSNHGFFMEGFPEKPIVHLRLGHNEWKWKISQEEEMMAEKLQISPSFDKREIEKIKKLIRIILSDYSYIIHRD